MIWLHFILIVVAILAIIIKTIVQQWKRDWNIVATTWQTFSTWAPFQIWFVRNLKATLFSQPIITCVCTFYTTNWTHLFSWVFRYLPINDIANKLAGLGVHKSFYKRPTCKWNCPYTFCAANNASIVAVRCAGGGSDYFVVSGAGNQ